MGDRNGRVNEGEQKLVELYMDLTSASESRARSVFMFVCSESDQTAETPDNLGASPLQSSKTDS